MPGRDGSGVTDTTSGALGVGGSFRGSFSGSGVASVVSDFSGLEPFNPKGQEHNLSQRAFNLYVTGKGVSNDTQKRALLLLVAGMDVQEIYFTIAGDGEDVNFEATLQVIDNYFIPEWNIPFERHMFRQILQEGGETVD